jgi:hypothetical protein
MTITLEPVTYSDVRFGPEDEPLREATRRCVTCENLFDFNKDSHLYVTTYQYVDSVLRWTAKYHYFCRNCTSECGDCGRDKPSAAEVGNYLDTYYYENLCARCSENYYTCDNCSESFHSDDMRFISNSDDSYCDSCIGRVATYCNECDQYEHNDDLCTPHDDNIHNYGYKPEPVFHGQDKVNSHLRFGIELEVEAKSGDLGEGSELMSKEWGDFCYLKEDSSLNFGFEIVTHPASLEYYQNEISWNTINKLRDLGFRSWNTSTCGLHVHIDRRAFKDRTHLLAFTYLLNNNTGLSQHLAGRNSREYAYIGSDSKHDNLNTIKGYGRGRGGDRYLAVNLQNSATVEIRMFKGSLKVERILSGIEYCHALVQYSRDIRSGNTASVMLRPEEFTSWIRKQGKYPNLVQFLPDFEVIEQDNNQMEE